MIRPADKSLRMILKFPLLIALATSCVSAVTTTKDHYAEHTVNYEAAFFYSPGEYTSYLKKLVQVKLDIHQRSEWADNSFAKRRLLDIGGGTGVFTRMLVENTNLEAVVIDPYLPSELLNHTLSNEEPDFHENKIQYISSGAESFVNLTINPDAFKPYWWQQNFDLVLFKEVVHHLDKRDRIPIFKALHRGFKRTEASSLLLIVTRPQYDIDYPLWPEARAVWAKNQPSLDDLMSDLKDAGFANIDSSVEAYPCTVPLKTWLQMVRSRFWSTFSHFSDVEIEKGCQWIEENIPYRSMSTNGIQVNSDGEMNQGVGEEKWIEFEDRLLLIRGYL